MRVRMSAAGNATVWGVAGGRSMMIWCLRWRWRAGGRGGHIRGMCGGRRSIGCGGGDGGVRGCTEF